MFSGLLRYMRHCAIWELVAINDQIINLPKGQIAYSAAIAVEYRLYVLILCVEQESRGYREKIREGEG